ncbi:MAG TPA: class I SAM-dependent methyltransferase [Chitinophagaceae bacterium]|nr:class I SAM-dependent methyltransferase [Chitinophagaceae bacterium]
MEAVTEKNLTQDYLEKPGYYFQFTRTDLLDLLPKQNQFENVLEVGAGGGNSLLYLKQQGIAKKVTGVELFELPGTYQHNELIDRFLIANIELLPADTFSQEFDAIICGDVLEHLADPWSVRDKLLQWLKPGGYFLASIPNIREFKTVLKILLRGTFTYEQGGVMDKTHLRFFGKKNIIELLSANGLRIETMVSNLAYPVANTKTRARINSLSFKIFEEFLAKQYFVLSKKQPIANS